MEQLTIVQKDLIKAAISNNERFRNSYFWGSPQYASERRKNGKR